MRFGRFRMTSKTQRIVLSIAALVIAILIGVLQGDEDPRVTVERAQSDFSARTQADGGTTGAGEVKSREEAVANAVRWLESQEGGEHRGHAIARHVGKSEADLRDRLDRQDISAASTFFDLQTAAVAIVRTIHHKPNDAKIRQWLGDDENRRRLALRRVFEKPIGRIVFRSGEAETGYGAVTVLTKWADGQKTGYRLLTAYVER